MAFFGEKIAYAKVEERRAKYEEDRTSFSLFAPQPLPFLGIIYLCCRNHARAWDRGYHMTLIPQEILQEMAEFVAGIRPWSRSQYWFSGRARELVRTIDRVRFEQIKKDQQAGIPELLREEGITIIPAPVRFLDSKCEPIEAREYEVYSAVCQQTDLFQFNLPDTIFEGQTCGDPVDVPLLRKRLEANDDRREYRVIEPRLAEQFSGPFRFWIWKHPEMLTDYEIKNQQRWPLEKRFEVNNGYRFVSELSEAEQAKVRSSFCISRVGFSTDEKFALVFLRYSMCCAYYMVFERCTSSWVRTALFVSWVS